MPLLLDGEEKKDERIEGGKKEKVTFENSTNDVE